MSPDTFAQMKAEYEAKKAEGLDDDALFDAMKAFYDTQQASSAQSDILPAEVGGDGAGAPTQETAEEGADGEAVPPIPDPVPADTEVTETVAE